MSAVNDLEGCTYMSQSLPFGGCKKSGYDRFAGPEGTVQPCALILFLIYVRVLGLISIMIAVFTIRNHDIICLFYQYLKDLFLLFKTILSIRQA